MKKTVDDELFAEEVMMLSYFNRFPCRKYGGEAI